MFFCGHKIQRVFDNLLRNAVLYSYPDTEIAITAEVRGSNAVICFRNHGDTIPEEKLARIFEQFYRLDTSRSTKTGGAGLGLSLVWEIAELHGGSVWVEESSDKGTTIAVELPAGVESAPSGADIP